MSKPRTIDRRNAAIGSRIRQARIDAKRSRFDLSVLLGCNLANIGHIEMGRCTISGPDVAIVATALGVSTDYLLTGCDRKATTAPIPAEVAHVA